MSTQPKVTTINKRSPVQTVYDLKDSYTYSWTADQRWTRVQDNSLFNWKGTWKMECCHIRTIQSMLSKRWSSENSLSKQVPRSTSSWEGAGYLDNLAEVTKRHLMAQQEVAGSASSTRRSTYPNASERSRWRKRGEPKKHRYQPAVFCVQEVWT